MLGHIQAPPPLSPPPPPSPPANIPEDLDDLYFEDNDDELKVAEVEDAVMAEAATEEEEVEEDEPEAAEEDKPEDDDNDGLAFLDDLPDPEEKAAEQRALLASFESAKKPTMSLVPARRPRRRIFAAA
jgi:hypothetical protein